jgi:cell wall assembly regulator SMI1
MRAAKRVYTAAARLYSVHPMNSSERDAPVVAEASAQRCERAWTRIVVWLARYAPEIAQALPAGASGDAIAALEAELGVALPTDLRRFLELADGTAGRLVVFPVWSARAGYSPWQVYSARGMAQMRRQILALYGGVSSPTEPQAQTDAWDRAWLPLGDPEYSRHLMCVDLRGAPDGAVFFVGIGEGGEPTAVAASFAELLERAADAMERGQVVAADRDEDGARYFAGLTRADEAAREGLLVRAG